MAALPLVQFDMFAEAVQAPPVETPAARATDPVSSVEAAEQVTTSGVRFDQQRRALAAVRAFPGRTSHELAEAAGIDRYELARRLPEVRTAGLVFNPIDESLPADPLTGASNPLLKRCSVTGRRALVWLPKSPGSTGRD